MSCSSRIILRCCEVHCIATASCSSQYPLDDTGGEVPAAASSSWSSWSCALAVSCRPSLVSGDSVASLSNSELTDPHGSVSSSSLCSGVPSKTACDHVHDLHMMKDIDDNSNQSNLSCLSLWLIGTVCAKPETVISRPGFNPQTWQNKLSQDSRMLWD